MHTCLFTYYADHTFGTLIKNGYSLLAYGFVATIVFTVIFILLTNRGRQVAQKCLPLCHRRQLKLCSCIFGTFLIVASIILFMGSLLIIASVVPRNISCGMLHKIMLFWFWIINVATIILLSWWVLVIFMYRFFKEHNFVYMYTMCWRQCSFRMSSQH